MMGICFDCLMKINGQPNQRACQVMVAADMTVERQLGAAEFEDL
jgi:succinate dehydrogenase/fumarate reductase-like Fe-S protein